MGSAVALAGWIVAAAALIAAALARKALAARAQSVARGCHELRGPLAAVRLGVELVARQGGLAADRLRAIELELGRAALALEDLERLRPPEGAGVHRDGRNGHQDAGNGIDIRALLADSVEAWRPAAAERGVEIRFRWAGGCATVAGERFRLAQATGNLIANAIEHGGGTVEVRGSASPRGARIEVLDHGPGLSVPVAELTRGSDAGRRRGHGLRVAVAVAALHGGRLSSAPSDHGARLVLELPGHALLGSAQAPRP